MENRSKLLSILVMGNARALAYIPWGAFGKPWSSLFCELSDSNFAETTKAKALILNSQKKRFASVAEMEWASKMANLRNALLCPFQISFHLLRILEALSQSGSGFRNSLLCQCLQIHEFSLLCVQQS